MAIIYITTDAQVPYEQTVALLHEFHAIWCPPPSLRNWNGTPSSEREPTVLVHRGTKNYVLLGSGVTRSNPRFLFKTHLLWSNRDLPGVRTRAIELGYTGPTNMSFLFLDDVHTARLVVSKEFGAFLVRFTSGLNVVPAHSVGRLLHLL
jgi:hypothetical protein